MNISDICDDCMLIIFGNQDSIDRIRFAATCERLWMLHAEYKMPAKDAIVNGEISYIDRSDPHHLLILSATRHKHLIYYMQVDCVYSWVLTCLIIDDPNFVANLYNKGLINDLIKDTYERYTMRLLCHPNE